MTWQGVTGNYCNHRDIILETTKLGRAGGSCAPELGGCITFPFGGAAQCLAATTSIYLYQWGINRQNGNGEA